jgi:hypothetical protein
MRFRRVGWAIVSDPPSLITHDLGLSVYLPCTDKAGYTPGNHRPPIFVDIQNHARTIFGG